MIQIEIAGLRDGMHPIDIHVPVSSVPDISPEFIGDIAIEGTLRKLGKRLFVDVSVQSEVALVCDRSGIDYTDSIEADLELEYVFDTDLANKQAGLSTELDNEDVRGLHEEDTVVDFTEDVRQTLIVAIPLRRVAPQYRDVALAEIFPEAAAADSETPSGTIDDRWAGLEKLLGDDNEQENNQPE